MAKLINNFEKVIQILAPLNMGYLLDSISEGYTNVDVYVNDETNPTVALIVEESSYYFCGDDDNEQILHDIIDFFKDDVLKGRKRENSDWAKIFYTSEKWRTLLSKRLRKLQPVTYERVLLYHDLGILPTILSAHDDIQFTEINQTIFDKGLENTKLLKDEIIKMWGSVDTFLRDGIGFCAIKDNELISWSTTRYKSKSKCGIGVRTISKYQRKGIATALCNHVLHECKKQNLHTYWDSWKTNSPSVSIAKKNGFKEDFTYEVFLIK
ncbi:GNAT family N-acetyltransferase [Haloplasma contractile]|uniref:GNAT acetyltransferase protein n=1 Tax=Haloplasma contractile SSD-17B TaxID=1033810 RepID=U2E0B6_9MOLU|nr:GNAT family N-acetyltransferase [Haloplasma contractile]ERJ13867.1 GNAT acetyltransferase protein [Haloplasma contractile SSD-17B]